MTGITGIGGINMCCGFTRGGSVVVTTDARTNDLRMVDRHHRYPGIGRVTVFTKVSRVNVRSGFTRCNATVMTGETGPQHLRMIHG